MSSDRPEETAAEPEPRLGTAVRYRLRLAVAEHHWPPAAHPSPPGRATLGGRLRPLTWIHRPRRQAVGPVQQERQP